MRIMVFDVPAESGGALSVLNDFYNEVNSAYGNDIEWIFVVSIPQLSNTEKVKVIRYPWIKRSWFHRLYFDHFIAPKLVKKYKVDKVLSIQNIIVPHIHIKQILYVHNSLPFIEYKFGIFENSLLWVYQNIMAYKIKNSIEKAELVIAQTNWMKKEFINKTCVPPEKVTVIPPKINIKITKEFRDNCLKQSVNFFYPASAVEFKNHKIIIDACKLLAETERPYQVYLTVRGDENKKIAKLKEEVIAKSLNIKFIGQISREEVFQMYSKSVLLFPSYVESSPLPLTEAALHNSIIIASDCAFSREILEGYKNAYLFDPFNPNDLSHIMKRIINNQIKHNSETTFKKNRDETKLDILDYTINV